jgi:hypothetical protein
MSAPPTAPITTSANSCYSPLRNRSRGLERVGVKFKPRLRSARPPIQLPAQSFNFPGSLAALLSRLSLLDALNHDKCRKIDNTNNPHQPVSKMPEFSPNADHQTGFADTVL